MALGLIWQRAQHGSKVRRIPQSPVGDREQNPRMLLQRGLLKEKREWRLRFAYVLRAAWKPLLDSQSGFRCQRWQPCIIGCRLPHLPRRAPSRLELSILPSVVRAACRTWFLSTTNKPSITKTLTAFFHLINLKLKVYGCISMLDMAEECVLPSPAHCGQVKGRTFSTFQKGALTQWGCTRALSEAPTLSAFWVD